MKYSETRKNQILENLSHCKLLNQSEYRNDEMLEALRDFSDALLEMVLEKEHASHLSIRYLGRYLLDQAESLGLAGDGNITYAAAQMDKLSYRIYALESGKKGENRANRAMFGIDVPNRILKNVEFTIEGEPFEIDFVIINQAGIFAIESKHFSRDMVIDQTGTLTEACLGNKMTGKKICMQMANQRAAVRHILTDAFPDDERMTKLAENIRSILLTTSDHSIVDLRGRETVLDCDTIADYLNNVSSEVILTREEINMLAETLEKASHTKVYPIGWDYMRVAEAFAIAIAKIEYASTNDEPFSEEPPLSEEFSSNDDISYENVQEHSAWKIAGSLATLAVAAGIGWKILKKFI